MPKSMSNQTNRTLEKKITRCLARLPSEHLLTLAKSREQTRLSLSHRCSQEWVALCWRATHLYEGDPISGLLESGKIDEDTYDRIWLLVLFWQRTWSLCLSAAPCIQEEFERLGLEYPFKTAFELFATIVWEETNNTFSICFKKPIEERRLRELSSQQQPNRWMALTLSICHQKATSRRFVLKSNLEMFYTALERLCNI